MKAKYLSLTLLVIFGAVLTAILWNSRGNPSVHAQDPGDPTPAEMPAGWQNMAAAEFIKAAETLFEAEIPATGAHQQAVATHAWSQFLNNEAFISGTAWSTVQAMLDVFVVRRNLLIDAGIPNAQVEANLATLRTRISARLESEPEIVTQSPLYGLGEMSNTLRRTGYDAQQRAQLFVDWVQANEWGSLPIHDLYNLYSWLNVDSVDRRHFSARWTGLLTPPISGAYTLRQVQQYDGDDSQIKIWLDDRLILDSTVETPGDSRFQSQPIELMAGQAIPIRVELVHSIERIEFSHGAPMAVLAWESSQVNRQIIPTTACMPPEGFGESGVHGLKGEYFADMAFSDLKVTRLDAALDFVSSWPPAAPIHQDECDAVLGACKEKLLSNAFLNGVATEDQEEVLSYNMWRIAYRMTATERRELVQKLTQNRAVLAVMTPRAMGRLMQAIYMLPGDEHLALLGAWAEARPQPRTQIGLYPGWGNGKYQTLNTDFYWLMGLFMQGPYWEDVETLWDEYLVRSNGECNLAIAYATAFAAEIEYKGNVLRSRLKEAVHDESLTGDQRMTWLLAMAFAKGVLSGGKPRPLRGIPELEEAMLVAESDADRFWALQELVAVLASFNQGTRAQELMDQYQSVFTSPEQQAAMTQWRAETDRLAAIYAARRESSNEP